MFEFTLNIIEILDFIFAFAIFSTCSLIYINSNGKYDVVVSTLFLKRNKLKNPFFAGYFGVILFFMGNFFTPLNIGVIPEFILKLIVIFGLFLIFVLIYKIHAAIYTTMKLNA